MRRDNKLCKASIFILNLNLKCLDGKANRDGRGSKITGMGTSWKYNSSVGWHAYEGLPSQNHVEAYAK